MKLEAIIERLQSRTWWNTFQERIEAVLDELGMFERAALVLENTSDSKAVLVGTDEGVVEFRRTVELGDQHPDWTLWYTLTTWDQLTLPELHGEANKEPSTDRVVQRVWFQWGGQTIADPVRSREIWEFYRHALTAKRPT